MLIKRNKKIVKRIILGAIIGLLIGMIGSVSYAFFSYSKTGNEQTSLVMGNIYLHLKEETKKINLENFEPQNEKKENEYYEFEVSGTNEADKDIVYDINILHGDNSNTNGAIRIDDKFVKFTLEKQNEQGGWDTVVDAKSYEDFNEAS